MTLLAWANKSPSLKLSRHILQTILPDLSGSNREQSRDNYNYEDNDDDYDNLCIRQLIVIGQIDQTIGL
jgi:hypothetical protein